MHYVNNTELSSLEETRCQFNGGPGAIKSAEGRIRPVCGLGIDVHQDFYVVVEQVDGSNPKPAQRFPKRSIPALGGQDRKSTRLNSSHSSISYAVFCLK